MTSIKIIRFCKQQDVKIIGYENNRIRNRKSRIKRLLYGRIKPYNNPDQPFLRQNNPMTYDL